MTVSVIIPRAVMRTSFFVILIFGPALITAAEHVKIAAEIINAKSGA